MNTWSDGRLLNCDVLSCLAFSLRGIFSVWREILTLKTDCLRTTFAASGKITNWIGICLSSIRKIRLHKKRPLQAPISVSQKPPRSFVSNHMVVLPVGMRCCCTHTTSLVDHGRWWAAVACEENADRVQSRGSRRVCIFAPLRCVEYGRLQRYIHTSPASFMKRQRVISLP